MSKRLLLVLFPILVWGCSGDSDGGGGSPPAPPAGIPQWDADRFPWPMFGRDPRRTGRSPFVGPQTFTAASARNWCYRAAAGAVINMQAVADDTGVYWGTWGILRRDLADPCDLWNKSDGRYYGLALATGQELFAPLEPRLNPTGYLFPGRPKHPRDVNFCGAGNDFHVSFYNGTIEGTALVDPDTGIHYVGRGDGRLFAIDPVAGTVLWEFVTFNPQLPDDPDGGGEVIGGPVMGPGKTIYIGTVAAPWPGTLPDDPAYETNAVYAVTTAGQMLWRYPSQAATLDNWLLGAPALSPDGETLYIGTWAADVSVPGRLIALDLTQPAGATDAQRLRWEVTLTNETRAASPSYWVRQTAVGPDGTIYAACAEAQPFGIAPLLAAFDSAGARQWLAEPQGYPSTTGQFVAGIALWEEADTVTRLYATTSHIRSALSNGEGGALFAIDPATGTTLGEFDPATLPAPGVGGMTAPTLGADETCYAGIRGKHHLTDPAQFVDGTMYAATFDPTTSQFTVQWTMPIDGNLDWVPPVIGPNGGLHFGSSDRVTGLAAITWHTLVEVPANQSPKFYCVFE